MPPGPAPFFRKPLVSRVQKAELRCPRCGRFHVDREEWANRPHHTHLCEHCDHLFERGAGHVYYAGVPPFTIRGRARAFVHELEDTLAHLIVWVLKK